MATHNRILLVNYDFPPAWSGTRRIVKFARYLQEEGFEPIILTSQPTVAQGGDTESLKEVLDHPYEVIRTPCLDAYHMAEYVKKPLKIFRQQVRLNNTRASTTEPGKLSRQVMAIQRKLMGWPDDRLPWLFHAVPVAESLLRRRAIRYVLTSSYPNSTHLLGKALRKKFRIHWHADFRDGWTQNPYFANYFLPGQKSWNRHAERAVVQLADSVTSVCDPITNHLQTLTDPAKVQTIPNGFDPNDMQDLPHPLKDERFTVVYTGTFMGHRQPDHFLNALRDLLDQHPGIRSEIRVIFCTNVRAEHRHLVQQLGLQSVVEFRSFVTYRQSLALQAAADLLLVIEATSKNSDIMLTQKIFEYLAAGPPILALAPPGALTEMVRRTRAGIVVEPENLFGIKELLLDFFLGRVEIRRNLDVINQFTRQQQAQDLARMLLQR